MFGKKKQPPIKSLVAHGSHIEGHYIFSEGLRVDGEVVGDIRANPDRPRPAGGSRTPHPPIPGS